MAISSALLIIGIMKNKEKLMYPTLGARVLVVIFVTVFGVTEVVVNPEEEAAQENGVPKPRVLQGKVMVEQVCEIDTEKPKFSACRITHP